MFLPRAIELSFSKFFMLFLIFLYPLYDVSIGFYPEAVT